MSKKNNSRLGTGLEALFGEDLTNGGQQDITPKTLPIEKIEPRAHQPRQTCEEEALEELAESIKNYGLIQPVTVRKLKSGYYQIVAGERRWRAARIAGLREVPVNIIDADDQTTAELALIENLHRQDLNPVEEAMGYQALMEEFGLTQEEVAERMGRARPTVSNALRLLSLPEQGNVALPGVPESIWLKFVNCFGGPMLMMETLTETLAQYDQNLVQKALRWESVQEYVRQYGIHPVEENRTVSRIPGRQE